MSRLTFQLIPCLLTLVAGCASDSYAPQSSRADAASRAAVANLAAPAPPSDTRPPAVWNGHAIAWSDLRPRLTEASGASVLEELILDAQVEAALRSRSESVSAADIAAEEDLVLGSLSPEATRAGQLLEELRTRRGLGPVRWEATLRRNAGLRRLAQSQVQISEETIAQAHEFLHGPRRGIRLIVVSDLATAQQAEQLLAAGTPAADVAARYSTDASAARGGLVDPVSRGDLSWPAPVREAVFRCAVGSFSEPIVVGTNYAIVRIEAEVPGDGADPATTREACQRHSRALQERVAMDSIARTLLAEADVTCFDPSLHDAWRRFRSVKP